MTPTHKIALTLLICTLLGLVGTMDYQDHLAAQSTYCYMVGLHMDDAALGIQPIDRRGWPEHPDRRYRDVCMTEEQRLAMDTIEWRGRP